MVRGTKAAAILAVVAVVAAVAVGYRQIARSKSQTVTMATQATLKDVAAGFGAVVHTSQQHALNNPDGSPLDTKDVASLLPAGTSNETRLALSSPVVQGALTQAAQREWKIINRPPQEARDHKITSAQTLLHEVAAKPIRDNQLDVLFTFVASRDYSTQPPGTGWTAHESYIGSFDTSTNQLTNLEYLDLSAHKQRASEIAAIRNANTWQLLADKSPSPTQPS